MKLIAKYIYTGSIPKWCPLPDDKDYTAIANNVKTLIEAQRCEWDGNDYGGYKTSCGKFIYRSKPNYCENCGCKVEVKDETN